MKIKHFLFVAVIFFSPPFWRGAGGEAFAQNIGINTTGATPNVSALLDVDAAPGNNKGLLIPRMTTVQMNAIATPATGLIIYNTDCNTINYYNGSTWIALGNTGSVSTPGAITGSATPCQNATGVSYSITAVSGATGYNWTVPTGASVATGQGTTSVTVDFATTDGNVCVTAYNACGASNASCTAITLFLPPAAPVANAASSITTTSFSANWTASAGATTYFLDIATDTAFTAFVTGYNDLPVGNVLTSSVTVTVSYCSTTYYYRVRASNVCDTSTNSNTITTVVPALNTITYTSSSSFTVPTCATNICIDAWGGGGGNGSIGNGTTTGGGGGGGGGYGRECVAVAPGTIYVVTIGAAGGYGGGGCPGNGLPGGAGGTTSVGSLVSAGGGSGGQGGASCCGIGGAGGLGGTSTATVNASGQNGATGASNTCVSGPGGAGGNGGFGSFGNGGGGQGRVIISW